MTAKISDSARSFAQSVLNETQKEMHGMEEAIKLCLVAIVARGHVLLEGNPGLGKTSLVRTLAGVLQLPWGRIQFTPDLMPSDITGTFMPRISKEQDAEGTEDEEWRESSGAPDDLSIGLGLEFRAGPLFTSLLLADEINRATPKTQAAMLEAMEEKQVTVLGRTFRLDERNYTRHIIETNGKKRPAKPQQGRPFIVLATQNPLDYEGTYELPKAQSDRFMFKLLVPVPDEQALIKILVKTAGVLDRASEQLEAKPLPTPPEEVVTSLKRFEDHLMTGVRAQPALREHIASMFAASNRQVHASRELARLTEFFEFGFGPRAARDLVRAAKAWTLLFETQQDQADAVALAHVAIPVLRHRLLLRSGWEDGEDGFQEVFGKYKSWKKERLVEAFLLEYCLACLPSGRGIDTHYGNLFKTELSQVIESQAT